MKRVWLAAGLVTIVLAGCQLFERRPTTTSTPSNKTPVVNVQNGTVKSVTPDPLTFSKADGQVKIVWSIDSSAYRFRPNGIVIDGEVLPGTKLPNPRQTEIVECMPANAERSSYSCVNKNTRAGTYKYTVNLETVDGKPLKPFDPLIVNSR